MSKYDWSNVDKSINWISTDFEGWKCYHTSKPKNINGLEFESEEDGFCGYVDIFGPYQNEYKGNFEDSLEERPK